jgi:hypothetical protein
MGCGTSAPKVASPESAPTLLTGSVPAPDASKAGERGIATFLSQKLDDLTKEAKFWVSVRVKADAAPQTLAIAGLGVTIGGLLDVFVTKKEASLYHIQVRGGVTVGGLAVLNGPDPLGLVDGDLSLGWETVGVFELEVGDPEGVWATINDLSNGKMPLLLSSLQIENGPFAQLLVNTQLSQFTQMAFRGKLLDIKAAITPILHVDFDTSGRLTGASLKVRCQGDGVFLELSGLSVVLMSLEGRILREVAAVLPIPSSVKSIKDLINEVPHELQYTDQLYVHVWPKSLFGGAFASFEINARLTPSEFSQVSVDIGDSLEDAIAEKNNISKSGVWFNYYIATVLTVPAPQLLAQFYGVGPELSSTLDFLLPIVDNDDNEHFFGLGDIIRRIKQSVGATNSNFGAPSQIHTDSNSSSRAAHILHACPQKTNCGEKHSA